MVNLVALLVRRADPRLVEIAAKLSLVRNEPDEAELTGLVGLALYFDPELGTVATEAARLAIAIGTAPDRESRVRRRGALLERLAYQVVKGRAGRHVFREHEVELTVNPRSRRQWTQKKEIVVEWREWEVYECKADCRPDIDDIDELSDIATSARAEGITALPVVVVFGDEATLRIRSKVWRMTETIYGIPTSGILELRSRPSQRFAL